MLTMTVDTNFVPKLVLLRDDSGTAPGDEVCFNLLVLRMGADSELLSNRVPWSRKQFFDYPAFESHFPIALALPPQPEDPPTLPMPEGTSDRLSTYMRPFRQPDGVYLSMEQAAFSERTAQSGLFAILPDGRMGR
jgi:hypothetical protein